MKKLISSMAILAALTVGFAQYDSATPASSTSTLPQGTTGGMNGSKGTEAPAMRTDAGNSMNKDRTQRADGSWNDRTPRAGNTDSGTMTGRDRANGQRNENKLPKSTTEPLDRAE